MNFALLRMSMFDEAVRWSTPFESDAGHEDLYLNLYSDHRFAYIPEIVAGYHHPRLKGCSQMRNRTKRWQLFLDRWNLHQLVDLDRVLRVNGSVEEMPPTATGREAFIGSLPLLI